jgi:hypothetical protein
LKKILRGVCAGAGSAIPVRLTAPGQECDHAAHVSARQEIKFALEVTMEIDPDKVVTQEETGEEAPVDQVEGRVEAEMKRIEGRAKESVAQGLQDEELAREARELQAEGERELEEQGE